MSVLDLFEDDGLEDLSKPLPKKTKRKGESEFQHKIRQWTEEVQQRPGRFTGGRKQAIAIAAQQAGVSKADQISGGVADSKKPSDFDPEELAEGVEHESEHTSDSSIAREIAMDHLTEDPQYYKKLSRVEKGYGWQPTGSGSYEGTGDLAGRATIRKETGSRGATSGFVLTLDGTEYQMPKRGSFDHADAIVDRHLQGGSGATQTGPRGGQYVEGPGGSKQYVSKSTTAEAVEILQKALGSAFSTGASHGQAIGTGLSTPGGAARAAVGAAQHATTSALNKVPMHKGCDCPDAESCDCVEKSYDFDGVRRSATNLLTGTRYVVPAPSTTVDPRVKASLAAAQRTKDIQKLRAQISAESTRPRKNRGF